MEQKKYLNIVKYGAIYDLMLTLLLTIPFTNILLIGSFQFIDGYFQLAGNFQLFEPIHFLFVSLMGIISVFWAILRIKHGTVLLGIYDAYMRLGIAAIIIIYILCFQVSIFFLSFFIFELILGSFQYYYGTKILKNTK